MRQGHDVKILSNSQTTNNNNSHREKSDRAKSRGNTENTNITNIASVITSASNLNIISSNNTTVQSSKLSAGDNLTIDSANNLLLLAANDVTINTHEGKSGTTYTFSNNNAGLIDVKAVNNEITANTNNPTNINSNLNLNANNSIIAQYRANSMNDVLSSTNNQNQQLAYLKTVNDLANSNPNKVTLDPIADNIKQWDDMTRGLTGAGTAVVAVAAVAVTVATLGSGATFGAIMLTAAGSTAAGTASVAATNASMNTDSSIWGSTKSIASNSWKSTTSKDSIENMAIAAITAGATAYGTSLYFNTASAGSTAGTSAAANTSTTIYVNPNLSSATALTTNTTNSSSFLTNLGNASVKIGSATGSNILATSAIKGQSLNQVITDQGGIDRVILSSALQIIGEAGAMQIGNAAHGSLTQNPDGTFTYHTPTITQGQQLALHAALGCGVGGGMNGASGCASGAVAGVVGEFTADSMYRQGNGNYGKNSSVTIAGISGSAASMFTSIALGDDDNKIAKNIYAGNFIATNAAANNATLIVTGTDPEQKKSSSKDLDPKFRNEVERTFGEKLIDFEWSGGNTKEARSEAAQKLNNIFEKYEFAPYEKFNLIGFSHGGNVLKEFTFIYQGEKKIDNMILLGTPNRQDYNTKFDLTDFGFYANKVSVSDVRDSVQIRGYIDGSVYKGGIALPHDIRMMPGFINVRADQGLGPIDNHINLPTQKVWNESVEPYLINK